MRKKWILVADGSRARIFKMDHTSDVLIELNDFTNPEARMADHEFEKDARGRFAGKNRHTPSSTAEPATEATRYSDEVFCKQIANHLEQNFDSHNYSEISIVAAPAFMGMLRKKISKKIHNIIKEEICKDVTSLSTHKMYAYLKEYLH